MTLVLRAAKSILAAARQFAVQRATTAVEESPVSIPNGSQDVVQVNSRIDSKVHGLGAINELDMC